MKLEVQGGSANQIVGSGDYKYEFIPNWGSFPAQVYNNGIAVNSHDRVYVVAIGVGTYKNTKRSDLVYVLDHDGHFLDSWGKGNCDHGHSVNCVDDILYICDKYGSVCLKYALDGRLLMMLGQHGLHSDTGTVVSDGRVLRPGGPFNRPDDFIRSPWGDLYAADGTHNARIHRFDSGGHLIQSWGAWGSDPGEFKTPHAVLPTKDRRVYVCDRANNRVQIFTPEGTHVDTWADDMQWPSKIVETLEGDFLVAEDPGNQTARGHTEDQSEAKARRPSGIRILDRNGKLITHLEVGKTHQMAINSRGDIYTATHTAVNKLVRINGPVRRNKPHETVYGAVPLV